MSDNIHDILRFDPLDAAEKLTGKSYKDDADTEALGCVMHPAHSQRKQKALEAADDTTLSNDLLNYLRIATSEGFKVVLEVPFKGGVLSDESYDERLFVLWHPDGILLAFDTYGGDRVNGGTFKYNWRPNDINDPEDVLSSGGFRKHSESLVWVGVHDCREALRFKLRRLRAKGTFLNPWVERPWLWLLHYMDSREPGYDHKKINEERIAMLPANVREAITPKVTQ